MFKDLDNFIKNGIRILVGVAIAVLLFYALAYIFLFIILAIVVGILWFKYKMYKMKKENPQKYDFIQKMMKGRKKNQE